VASAGGLINYETKRPATIQAVDLATDHRGSSFGAVDLGRLFGSRKQVGARVNLAGEKIMSYVNDANGWRAMGAGSSDWKFSPRAILKGDFEYQHKVERSVCGYQLLGGTTVPNLHKTILDDEQVYPSTMLGEQSWAKPNTFDTYNTGARLDYDLPRGWRAFAAASYSHSLIDDNVVYAYGCYNESECNSGSAPYPWFFAPDGTYDIYDYRNPGELRIDAQAEAIVTGHVKTGSITHDVTGGGELFLRSVQQPGFYTIANPYSPDIHTSAPRISMLPSRRLISPPRRFRFNLPARADSGKTTINHPLFCRTAFIFPATFNCWLVGDSMICATTTIPFMHLARTSSLRRIACRS
jgi:iron complex outermembrane receptor protein